MIMIMNVKIIIMSIIMKSMSIIMNMRNIITTMNAAAVMITMIITNMGHHHADDVFESWGLKQLMYIRKQSLKQFLMCYVKMKISYGLREWLPVKRIGIIFDLVPHEAEIRKGSKDVIGKLCVIGTHIDKEAVKQLFRLV